MMKTINNKTFWEELRPILSSSMGSDYAGYLAKDDDFFFLVKQNVEETSAWVDEGYYTDDDIRLAIGRVILDRFDILY